MGNQAVYKFVCSRLKKFYVSNIQNIAIDNEKYL